MYLGKSFITTASQIIATPAITPYYTAAVYQEQEEAFALAS